MKNSTLELFEKICSIPHLSGHEENLSRYIIELAEAQQWSVRRDMIGNLRIERPASPGFENKPSVIMQGHLDMVGQSDTDGFDFVHNPIRAEARGEYLYSANGTTLGADNGIGVAAALSIMLDDTLECGPLIGLFTVSEEVGLIGASRIGSDLLEGGILLNLDSEEEGELCIGGAGGVRLRLEYPIISVEPSAGSVGAEIELSGFKGGHSGLDIGLNRGNAIIELCRFLSRCELQMSDLFGGDLDNAIPRKCCAIVATKDIQQLGILAVAFSAELRQRLDLTADFELKVTPCKCPEEVWGDGMHKLKVIAETPNGVLSFDEEQNIVSTSSNLASVKKVGGNLLICTSQRGMCDSDRNTANWSVRNHFPTAKSKIDSEYPAWTPKPESALLITATELYSNLFKSIPSIKAIHAGLECGWLIAQNPNLEILSFGPTIQSPHSPSERLLLPSVERFYKFLYELIKVLGR